MNFGVRLWIVYIIMVITRDCMIYGGHYGEISFYVLRWWGKDYLINDVG